MILYTEGHTHWDVRTDVSARYLWFCGGTGAQCQRREWINFLSYLQPWREPWLSRGFTSDNAAQSEDFARGLVNQKPGLLTTIIPGAETDVHSENALSSNSSIDWYQTPFHFANADPTWDAYLCKNRRRSPNRAARLWVLTISEAGRVCSSQFICPHAEVHPCQLAHCPAVGSGSKIATYHRGLHWQRFAPGKSN